MNCPICSSPMAVIDYSGVTLDQCTSCMALWFDRTEFAAAMERDVPSVTIQWGKSVKDRPGPVRKCPRDASAMKAMEWDGVLFDRCARCAGVLLSEESWKAVHEAAEARAKGSKFSPVEIMRDLFNM
jgi:Zn-finger nucleic acid-binding protein